MSGSIFLNEYKIYKPVSNKTDAEVVDALVDCKDNRFHSFGFNYVCDVEFNDIMSEKIINEESLGYSELKKHIETILTGEKKFRFVQINIRCYLSSEVPFVNRLFFRIKSL